LQADLKAAAAQEKEKVVGTRNRFISVGVIAVAISACSSVDEVSTGAEPAESTTSSVQVADPPLVEDTSTSPEIAKLFESPSAAPALPDGLSMMLDVVSGDVDPEVEPENLYSPAVLVLSQWRQPDGTLEYTAQFRGANFRGVCAVDGILRFQDSTTTAIWRAGVSQISGGFEEPMVECDNPDLVTGYEYLFEGEFTMEVSDGMSLEVSNGGGATVTLSISEADFSPPPTVSTTTPAPTTTNLDPPTSE